MWWPCALIRIAQGHLSQETGVSWEGLEVACSYPWGLGRCGGWPQTSPSRWAVRAECPSHARGAVLLSLRSADLGSGVSGVHRLRRGGRQGLGGAGTSPGEGKGTPAFSRQKHVPVYVRAGRGSLPGTKVAWRHRDVPEGAGAGHLRLLISGLRLLYLDRVGPTDGKLVGLSKLSPELKWGAVCSCS